MKPDSTAHEIYRILEKHGVPSNRTLECANELVKPYSVLLEYAVRIGYKVDPKEGHH